MVYKVRGNYETFSVDVKKVIMDGDEPSSVIMYDLTGCHCLRVRLVGSKVYTYLPTVEGNTMYFHLQGYEQADTYGLEVTFKTKDNQQKRSYMLDQITLVESVDELGIDTEAVLDGEHSHLTAVLLDNGGGTGGVTREELEFILNGYVEKVDGMGLSSNDYTNEEKEKLEGLENYNDQELKDALDKKVDKVVGKGLSENDFTNSDKQKLDSTPTQFAPTDAQKNVNADWNATSGDAQILNKPTSLPASDVSDWAKQPKKPSYTATEVGAYSQESGIATLSRVVALENVGAQKNVQSDWKATSGDAFIKNKPEKLSDFRNDTNYFGAFSHQLRGTDFDGYGGYPFSGVALIEQTDFLAEGTTSTYTYHYPSPHPLAKYGTLAHDGIYSNGINGDGYLLNFATLTKTVQMFVCIGDEYEGKMFWREGYGTTDDEDRHWSDWHEMAQLEDTTCEVVEMTEMSATIEPNKFYKWGVTPAVDITLAEPFDKTIVNEYHFSFIADEDTILILPADVIWQNNQEPKRTAGNTYEVSIIDNCASFLEFVPYDE